MLGYEKTEVGVPAPVFVSGADGSGVALLDVDGGVFPVFAAVNDSQAVAAGAFVEYEWPVR